MPVILNVSVRAEEQSALAQKACHELGVNLSRSSMEKQTLELKMSSEIDDLSRTKRNLEERLIELIRCRLLCLPPEQFLFFI